MRLRPWQLSLAALAICGLTLVATSAYRQWRYAGYEWLFQRLPTDHAVIAGIDVAALRRAGLLDLLAGSKAEEELEYRSFVERIGFDYRTDLDYVAASIGLNDGSRHFLLNGRFDWKALMQVAEKSGGHCLNVFCYLPGFRMGRSLSFLPVTPSTLGVSVSTDQQAAWVLAQKNPDLPVIAVPAYPIFLAMDAGLLGNVVSGVGPLQPLWQRLTNSEWVVLGLEPGHEGGLQFALDADCLSAQRAGELRNSIEELGKTPGTTAAILHGGSVSVSGRSVHARWPIERSALERLLAP